MIPMSNTPGTVIIVGGGVIGASCAYYLHESGWTVTIIDKGGFGDGCSHANCGFVCPSHVLPLAGPGAVKAGIKALFQPNGAFTIKPRLDFALWSWLYRFARRCNERDMIEAGRAIQSLLNSSRALYDELMADEAFDCEWETRGLLFAFAHRDALEHYGQTDKLMRESFGVGARHLDAEAMLELEPALKPGLAGGWFYETDAHLRPDSLMTSWRWILHGMGVQLIEDCPVNTIIREGGRARALTTDQGEMTADAVILATGALTPLFNAELGCKIPIQPGKGYSITMPRPAKCPSTPLIFEEHRVAVTPWQSGYRLGSTMEFAGYDSTLNRKRLELLKTGAAHYLQEPYCEPVEEEWFGWRPMTYDGIPLIDRTPAMSNVLVAAGHNMLGLSMAPATGKLVAEMLNGQPPHIDPAPYSVNRF